tara:strand:- start:3907 stop:4524 length:618 start_codon:yes stop_codon:yes gene_type:complete
MNVWITVITCIVISSTSLGVSYYAYTRYKKKNVQVTPSNDIEEEMVIGPESPVIIPILTVTSIKLLHDDINKICRQGIINPSSSTQVRDYYWYKYPIVNDNYMFKVSLSIGLKTKRPISVIIDSNYNIVINHRFDEIGTKINLYLSGIYFSEYLDDFIYIDDISKYDKKTSIYSFDKKPLLKIVGINDIICKFDSRSIKLQIISN